MTLKCSSCLLGSWWKVAEHRPPRGHWPGVQGQNKPGCCQWPCLRRWPGLTSATRSFLLPAAMASGLGWGAWGARLREAVSPWPKSKHLLKSGAQEPHSPIPAPFISTGSCAQRHSEAKEAEMSESGAEKGLPQDSARDRRLLPLKLP